jgi:hypothetical protein
MANVRAATDSRRISAIVVIRSTAEVGSIARSSRRTSAASVVGSPAARTTRCFENAPDCQNGR